MILGKLFKFNIARQQEPKKHQKFQATDTIFNSIIFYLVELFIKYFSRLILISEELITNFS